MLVTEVIQTQYLVFQPMQALAMRYALIWVIILGHTKQGVFIYLQLAQLLARPARAASTIVPIVMEAITLALAPKRIWGMGLWTPGAKIMVEPGQKNIAGNAHLLPLLLVTLIKTDHMMMEI